MGTIDETQLIFHTYTVYSKNSEEADSQGTANFHIDADGGRYRTESGAW